MRNVMWVGGGITGIGNIPMLGVREKGMAKAAWDIFHNSEQGFVYDPNDLSTMFQDAAGTIPVTAAGQPVGLVLDKSKGLVKGVEKWVDSSASFTGGSSRISTGTYRIYTPDGTYSSAQILGALTIGRMYEISFDVVSIANTGGGVIFEGSPVLAVTTVGKKRQIITATSVNLVLKRADALLTNYTVTNISVREIAGNHAYQTTSASRPILRKNAVTGANYLEFDGWGDFLQTSNIDFTGTDKVSLFAGVQKLSDATSAIVAELSPSSATNNGSFHLAAPDSLSGNNYQFSSRGTVRSISVTPPTYISPISNVVSVAGEIASNTAKIRVDGAQVAQSTATQGTGNYGNYPLYIGRRGGISLPFGGISLPFGGHIYGLIGVGKLASDSETKAIEKELAKRVGVTLNV